MVCIMWQKIIPVNFGIIFMMRRMYRHESDYWSYAYLFTAIWPFGISIRPRPELPGKEKRICPGAIGGSGMVKVCVCTASSAACAILLPVCSRIAKAMKCMSSIIGITVFMEMRILQNWLALYIWSYTSFYGNLFEIHFEWLHCLTLRIIIWLLNSHPSISSHQILSTYTALCHFLCVSQSIWVFAYICPIYMCLCV